MNKKEPLCAAMCICTQTHFGAGLDGIVFAHHQHLEECGHPTKPRTWDNRICLVVFVAVDTAKLSHARNISFPYESRNRVEFVHDAELGVRKFVVVLVTILLFVRQCLRSVCMGLCLCLLKLVVVVVVVVVVFVLELVLLLMFVLELVVVLLLEIVIAMSTFRKGNNRPIL